MNYNKIAIYNDLKNMFIFIKIYLYRHGAETVILSDIIKPEVIFETFFKLNVLKSFKLYNIYSISLFNKLEKECFA